MAHKTELETNLQEQLRDPLAHLKAIKENIVDKATMSSPPSERIYLPEEVEGIFKAAYEIMSSVDSVWRERLLAIREEKGWDYTHTMIFCAGKTLNLGNHLENFSHHFFDSEAAANPLLLGKAKCEMSDQPDKPRTCVGVFVPKKPMQRFCSNECGEVAERKQIAETRRKAEMDARRKRVMKDAQGHVQFSVGGEPEGNPSPPSGHITRSSVA